MGCVDCAHESRDLWDHHTLTPKQGQSQNWDSRPLGGPPSK